MRWLALLFAALPLAAQDAPLTASFRVGGQVGFGNSAEAETQPWAALWTRTRLATGVRAPLLLTLTQLTAAPGREFKLTDTAALRSLQFEAGLAIPLRAAWNFSLYVGGGFQGRIAKAGEDATQTPRWVEVGVYVASSPRGWLRITAAEDERAGAWKPAMLVAGSFDIMPGPLPVSLCGQARITKADTRAVLAIGVGR